MEESVVTDAIKSHLESQGLHSLGKLDIFNHVTDDSEERTFKIDLAFAPEATKGRRTTEIRESDMNRFDEAAPEIDRIVRSLGKISVFPTAEDLSNYWCSAPNLNPMVGIAIEVENSNSKYFLGSLLAASVAGRWGVLIAPDCTETTRWIQTIRRIRHKGNNPIPSNIYIFNWEHLQQHIANNG